jgi:hypothetical protein
MLSDCRGLDRGPMCVGMCVCGQVDDRAVMQESTRELLSMFYGLLFAYDEGLAQGDATLAAALWRCASGQRSQRPAWGAWRVRPRSLSL